jgi:hypothetical protein
VTTVVSYPFFYPCHKTHRWHHGEVSLTQGRHSRTLIIDSRACHYGELRFSLTPCLPFQTEKSRVLFPGDNGNVSQAQHSRPSTRHSCAFERVRYALFFLSFRSRGRLMRTSLTGGTPSLRRFTHT